MNRPPGEPPPGAALLIDVLDAFLDWTKANQAAKTYTWHRGNIQAFVDTIPRTMTVAEMKPFHVTRPMDAHPNWSNSTKNGFARSVQRALRWAETQGHIERTPIPRVEKPGRETREVVVTPEEFEDLLSRFPDEEFRDVLVTCWETGCRPQELMAVEARHVDLANDRWVFRVKESKGRRSSRIVYLSDRAAEITRQLVGGTPPASCSATSTARRGTRTPSTAASSARRRPWAGSCACITCVTPSPSGCSWPAWTRSS